MFILIVGSMIRHCSQLGFENSLLHLRSSLPSSLFLLLLLYMSFFFSINRLFFYWFLFGILSFFFFYKLKGCLVQSCLLELSIFFFFDFSCFIIFLGFVNHRASLIQWLTPSVWFGNLSMQEFCESIVWKFLGFILVISFALPFFYCINGLNQPFVW